MLCEAFLGIEPHFALWIWVFRVAPSFLGSAFPMMGGARIKVWPDVAGRYLALGHAPGFDAVWCWQWDWLYLPNIVLVLPAFLQKRLSSVALASW